jgi:phosphate transport system permease protein
MFMSRTLKDILAHKFMRLMTILICVLFAVVIVGLYLKSSMILEAHSLKSLLFGKDWYPMQGKFGFYPFITGTFAVTLAAMLMAVPLSLFTVIYLSEYAHERVRAIVKPLVDLLAAIPSVVYGIWGILVIVPFIRNHVAPWFGVHSSGYCILTAGMVLAIMVFPIIISITDEIMQSIPIALREASLSLGASRWQTVKHVVLRKAMPGILAAVILGFARAFGETMAVMMVAGNVVRVPTSFFSPAYTLPALIANNYGEIMSIPLYDSALMLASFILLIVMVSFNFVSRLILMRVERNIA